MGSYLKFSYGETSMTQIRLNKNYRSTKSIVEAATALIHNNTKRDLKCHKLVETDNPDGSKVSSLKHIFTFDVLCMYQEDPLLHYFIIFFILMLSFMGT